MRVAFQSISKTTTVRSGKVSQWPKGVSFVCDAAASRRKVPGVTRCPNFNAAAAVSHFLDARHLHVRVYAHACTRICAHIYAYMLAYTHILNEVYVVSLLINLRQVGNVSNKSSQPNCA